ncbi:16S rRNA (uracil1498-N3)-methyltransferase [Arthrobacter sp. CAN_A212]|uniref:16S rRNA (uracil(1498)-N(3))-methyltransferase n=1 Tax=unclassified Arthrobacter TaxID=235627 RepID=UPI0018C96C98|nr:16S rRNA (uracil(1498)-N(3))-methyltransferase [Arthrobacter sp. CAN_C5]MBP2216588.1 16S rRNA (uracil1498-N3)-methyltransferase [Arthrobacter sp. CAN_C5]
MSNALYFGDPDAVSAAAPGSRFVLTGAEARHAATVKRVTVGEAIDVADGRGRRLTGTVAESSGQNVTLEVSTVDDEPAPATALVLVQALAKGDRDLQAVEAATELGVDAVVPWQADRSIVRWRAEKAVKGRQKWESTVWGAAKQSRRARLPEVHSLHDSRSLAGWLAGVDLALVLHEEAVDGLGTFVGSADQQVPDIVAVVVGPEGGISTAELELFLSKGAHAARMGDHVLRSSTAGPAALAVLNQLLGRW